MLIFNLSTSCDNTIIIVKVKKSFPFDLDDKGCKSLRLNENKYINIFSFLFISIRNLFSKIKMNE